MMKKLCFFLYFIILSANAKLYVNTLDQSHANEEDFEIEAKMALNALYDVKSNSFKKYNNIINGKHQVLKDALMLSTLNYIDYRRIDLREMYRIFLQYPELSKIAHKFATPILKLISENSSTNRQISLELIRDYFMNANLSLEQKIELIRACVRLDMDRIKCIKIINKIWAETDFENMQIWRGFLQQYRSVLNESSHFEQAKILLIRKKYEMLKEIKQHIQNNKMLSSINAAEKIAKNNITNVEFLDKINTVDDIIMILLIDNFKDKHNKYLYYKVGMKAKCESSGIVRQELWKRYKYSFHEMVKNASEKDYQKTYDMLAHCNIFEGEDYIRQQFLLGWLQLEHLNAPEDAMIHFMNLLSDSADHMSTTRGYYWLGRVYARSKNMQKAYQYYQTAAEHPFYFYGQMAMLEIGENMQAKILSALSNLQKNAFNYYDKTDNTPNLLTYISKIFYKMGRHDISRYYTRFLLSLSVDPEIRASCLHRITYRTERDFAINMGRYGRMNGVPLIDISYPQHDNDEYSPIVKAVILKESMFDHSTLSNKQAKGLMQVRGSVFKTLSKEIKVKKINNKNDNVLAGSYLLQKLINRYGNNTLALAAYNAGPTAVERWIKEYGRPTAEDKYANINWIESIPFEETRNYIMRVTESFIVYDSTKQNRYMCYKNNK